MAGLNYKYIASLVKRVQAEDSNAFAELYATTYTKQYKFAYNYLKDEYLAQDALQETYILALRNIYTIQDPKLFVAWLNQINFRVCLKLLQKQKVNKMELVGLDITQDIRTEHTFDNPESQVIQVDEKEYVLRQVMSLPFSESQSILLKYYNNMTLAEIADVLECSKSSVKRYIKSGQNRLRKLIKQ